MPDSWINVAFCNNSSRVRLLLSRWLTRPGPPLGDSVFISPGGRGSRLSRLPGQTHIPTFNPHIL